MAFRRCQSNAIRFTSLLVLLYSSSFVCNAQSLSTTCYRRDGGIQRVSDNRGPCGIISPTSSFYSCCTRGDQCLENGLCFYTHDPPAGSNATGYYVGGCTDPSLADPSCNPACGTLNYQDITFNKTSKQWLCCGASGKKTTCDDPTTEIVSGKAISSIATTYVVPATIVTIGASTTATSSPTVTSEPTASSSSSSGTSTGVIVGGVVGGVAGGAVLTAIFAAIWFFRRRARASEGAEGEGEAPTPSAQSLLNGHVEKAPEAGPDAGLVELQTYGGPAELNASYDEHAHIHDRGTTRSELS